MLISVFIFVSLFLSVTFRRLCSVGQSMSPSQVQCVMMKRPIGVPCTLRRKDRFAFWFWTCDVIAGVS
jgi:hypothetical protein